jgi:hypothetical protein
MRLYPLLLLIIISARLPASGNDGFGALGVGGIVVGKTDAIALKKEILDLSYERISVEYEFVNESTGSITSDIIFPLPAYPAEPSESGIIAAGEPGGFTVTVDGEKVRFATGVRATIGAEDVTGKLRSAGFTDKEMALIRFDKTMQDDNHRLLLPAERIAALKRNKLLSEEGDAPAWDVHVTYQWKQTFPAGSLVKVRHTYTPFIAEGTAGGFDGVNSRRFKAAYPESGRSLAEFCLSESQADALNSLYFAKKNLDGYGQVPGTIVRYVLTTANTWKDGVRDFTLRIRAGSPDEVVALCFPEPLKKTAPAIYEVKLKNFRPKSDLGVYFGNTRPGIPSALQFNAAPRF